MRQHHAFDTRRFLPPGDDPEGGYGWFLEQQLGEADTAVIVADQDGTVVGYVYAGIEPRSWKELRDECGFVHDLFVTEPARRRGAGRRLLEAAFDWMRAQGMPRVVLWTAEQNTSAQEVFAQIGFRRTMVEMTREL